jgi:hypothetical protein
MLGRWLRDLTELVEFWEENKRIGNRLELMQSSVSRRLTKLLLREVDRDLRVEKVKVETHYVLADLSWSGSTPLAST